MQQLGSVDDTVARLTGWLRRSPYGLGAVEFDSEFARLQVMERLRGAFRGTPVVDVEIGTNGQSPEHAVISVLETLSRIPSGIASITGFHSGDLDSEGIKAFLRLINLQRDVLANYPLWQIWWMPTNIAEHVGRAMPDLNSWFLIRLHLSVPALTTNFDSLLESGVEARQSILGIQEARALADGLMRRAEAAATQGHSIREIWHDLARPAVEALRRADLEIEAEKLESTLRERIGSPDPRIFISYSSDSAEHTERVLHLATRLRADGVPVVLDLWEPFPGEGWSRWVARQVHDAEFVLAVCTQTYRDRVMGDEVRDASRNRGLLWEGAAIYRSIAEPASQRKVIPILFEDGTPDDIPSPLRTLKYLRLNAESSYRELLRILHPVVNRVNLGQGSLTTTVPEGSLFPMSNVPAFRSDMPFVGREKVLDQLEQYMTRKGPKIISITGAPGIGKTQLCLEFLHRTADRYQATLWSRADSEPTISSGMAEVGRLLNLPERELQDQNRVREGVRSWLQRNERWVLVLDDAERLSDLIPLIPDSVRGTILITSRKPLAIPGDGSASIDLPPLTSDETLQILLSSPSSVLRSPEEQTGARELAEALGGIPLAAQLARTSLSKIAVTEYLRQLREQISAVSIAPNSRVSGRTAAAWRLTAMHVGQQSPASLDLLRFSAFFAPGEEVPLDLLAQGEGELVGKTGELLRDSLKSGVARKQLINILADRSLIALGQRADRYFIHDLTQLMTRDSMVADEITMWGRLTINVLNRVFPTPSFENWSDCDLLVPHAMASALFVESLNLRSPQAADLLKKAGFYLFERARYTDAEWIWEQARRINQQLENPAELAACLNDLALLFDVQGRIAESERLFREAIEIRERTQGRTHPDIAPCLSNLANLYQEQGRFREAEDLQARSLDIRQAAFGPEHPETAGSLNNLALLYDMQGRFLEAEELMRRALQIRERVLSGEHPAVASTLQNLGNILAHLGRFNEAIGLYERALPILERALGLEHPDVATTLNNLGSIYLTLGNMEQAEDLLRKALEIRQRTLGLRTPVVAGSLSNLGVVYSRTGRVREAQLLFQQALTIFEEVLGPEHARTVHMRAQTEEAVIRLGASPDTYQPTTEERR